MFAYLFWHTLKPGLPSADYEQGLAAFGKALLECGCAGLRGTGSFRISEVPWLDGQAGYEDWALVDGPGTLEAVNVAAVSGAMAPLHGRVANAMGIGHGGLYDHLWGDLAPFSADAAQWLTRPRGIEFRPVLEAITRSAGQPVSVWRRFMVLGPGKEFLVLGRDPLRLQLPPGWQAHGVRRSAVSRAA
ncbi:MAG TPA: hypothetical protein VFY39_13450 [Gammaproteobacteria bacterium]|nr:hypothetical protein [Gammaproteobacteria bacterium]